jgi:hypothetical protein
MYVIQQFIEGIEAGKVNGLCPDTQALKWELDAINIGFLTSMHRVPRLFEV